VLQIAPSAYRRYAARRRDQTLCSARARRDGELMPKIEQVWKANLQVYGADKVWKQMNRENVVVARCTVERLMRRLGLRGVRRGTGGAHDDQRQQSAVSSGQGRPAVPS
jgi:putative transposase